MPEERREAVLIYLTLLDDPAEQTIFAEVYRLYAQQMYRLAFDVLKNVQDAEDAVHEAFLRLVRYTGRLAEADHPRTRALVLTVTRSIAIDLYRSHRRKGTVPWSEDLLPPPPPPESHGLGDVFAALPEGDRAVLLLRYDMGFSVEETARILGKSANAVTKHIIRARRHLQEALEKEGIEV